MLDGAISHPDKWEWYAMWMIELHDGTHVGELCFKGIDDTGTAEIGYGICEEHRGHGYATEAVAAVSSWALVHPGISCVSAEVERSNTASRRVLETAGFTLTDKTGDEGPIYRLGGDQ